MRTRTLGRDGLVVSELGLGCMGMTWLYGHADENEAIATLHRAVDLGITFFDTAEVYGPYTNELLVGRVLKSVRDKVVIATKFGFEIGPGVPPGTLNSTPENVRRACDESLKRLQTDRIDLYYQHRVDPAVPIEATVGAMAALVTQGKVRHLGLSEASPETLRRACAVHPIAALQNEYSLWTRDPEDGALAACKKLGVGFVAYSPLGRGFLTGALASLDDLEAGDARRNHPRFSSGNFERNRAVFEPVRVLAQAKGVASAQIALAWVLSRGDDVVPIPGTKRVKWLEQNVGATEIRLSAAEIAALDAALPKGMAAGERYGENMMKLIERAN